MSKPVITSARRPGPNPGSGQADIISTPRVTHSPASAEPPALLGLARLLARQAAAEAMHIDSDTSPAPRQGPVP